MSTAPPSIRAQPTPAVSESATPLSRRTAHGFAWLVGQTILSKVTSLAGQLVLAWRLDPKDFGLVGLAFTVSAFGTIVQQVGLKEILIQRQRHFGRWATAAFWMSVALGFLAAALMIAGAPIAARIYGARELIGMVAWIAAAAPIAALSVVPMARLQIDMRFRAVAAINYATGAATILLSIVFAYQGYRAYSFVMPMPLVAAGQSLAAWWLARPAIGHRPLVRRWKFLAGDGTWVLGAYICYTAFSQGDYVVLGVLHPEHVVGIYYFAFNLSMQSVTLFTINLWGVLLPALSKIQDDPARQLTAFTRAARGLAAVAVPMTLLQAALAGPLVRTLFATKWETSIPVLQILSVGMALATVGAPGGSLLQSRGRFRTLFFAALGSAAVFLVLITIGASAGAARAVAFVVAVFYAAYGPVNLYIGLREVGGTWGHVRDIYLPAFTATVLAVGAGLAVSWTLPATRGADLWTIATVTAVTAVVYVPLIRRFMPDIWRELMERLHAMGRSAPVTNTVEQH